MKKFIFSIAVLFTTAIFSFGQQQLPNDPAVRVGKLENGLTYYIRHNDKPAQRAEFWLATNVGAYQEEDHQDGLAHFLEHMCFNGTKNFPGKSLLEYLQSIGAEFGRNINASTGFEVTQYMLNNIPVVRETIIDSCLLILHDYSHFVNCEPAEIDAERGVIMEEKRQLSSASWRMFEKGLPYIYGGTPYEKRTLIGSFEQLETFEYKSLTDFYKKWYNPDMQAVIVVGDVDVDKVEQKIKTIFSDIPAPAVPTVKPVVKIPVNEEPIIGIITDPEASYSYFDIIWKSEPMPEQFNSTDVGFMMTLIKSCISQIIAERFNDIAAEPDSPFIQASCHFDSLCETCDAFRGMVVFKEGNALEAFEAFMTEMEKMKRYGFNDSEIQRAKDNIISHYQKAVEASSTRTNNMLVNPLLDHFFDNESYLEPAVALQLAEMICAQLNAQPINQFSSGLITDNNMIVMYNGPEKEGLVSPSEEQIKEILVKVKSAEITANAEDNLDKPLLNADELKGSSVKKTAESIYGSTEWTLKNGLKVVILPTEYKKDEVRIKLYKKGGKSLMSDEELFSFEDNIWLLYCMNSGVSEFSGTDLPKMLAGKNLSVMPFINELNHGIIANCTPKDIETALQLMYLYFTDPRFDQNEYQKGIKQIEAILPNMKNQPDFIFQEKMTEIVFGNNPRKININEEVMKKASLENIERVYRELFNDAAGTTVIITGNVDLETLKPLVERYLGSLPKGKKASKWIDRDVDVVKGEVVEHITTPMETPKTYVLMLYSAYQPASYEEEILLGCAQYILDLIYTKTIREEAGGTYGVSVGTAVTREPKPKASIQIVFQTNEEQAPELIQLAKDGLFDLAENGPTEEQVKLAVENYKKNVPENRIQNWYWASVIESYYMYGVDKDGTVEDIVNGITADKIQALIQKIIGQGNNIEFVLNPAK